MELSSPFPGMDPWLERSWGDVHARVVMYAAEQLQPRLPPDLRARVEERVFVESPSYRERRIAPDVRVVQGPTSATRTPVAAAGNGAPAAQPVVVEVPDEPVTETFVEIREARPSNRLVTVIEVLSPTNKRAGEGQDLYRQKQLELKRAGISLVEIDLLRRGEHALAIPRAWWPQDLRTPYRACVTRGAAPRRFEVYGFSLREPLPSIQIPLRAHEPDVPLDLQAVGSRVYRAGAYDDIDYREDPDPPLESADAVWADELLRARGLR